MMKIGIIGASDDLRELRQIKATLNLQLHVFKEIK